MNFFQGNAADQFGDIKSTDWPTPNFYTKGKWSLQLFFIFYNPIWMLSHWSCDVGGICMSSILSPLGDLSPSFVRPAEVGVKAGSERGDSEI